MSQDRDVITRGGVVEGSGYIDHMVLSNEHLNLNVQGFKHFASVKTQPPPPQGSYPSIFGSAVGHCNG